VEQSRNNKLSYAVASCWSFSYIVYFLLACLPYFSPNFLLLSYKRRNKEQKRNSDKKEENCKERKDDKIENTRKYRKA